MHNFKDLQVWERSMSLAKTCYSLTDVFPKREEYGLVSQIRRSAVSIPSNIAEGSGRGTERDFARFIWMAYGSACELETQILISRRLGLTAESSTDTVVDEIDEIRRMLYSFAASLKAAAS